MGNFPQFKDRQDADLWGAKADGTSCDLWAFSQKGLVYPSPYAVFLTFWRSKKDLTPSFELLQETIVAVHQMIESELDEENTTAIVGVGFKLWQQWCQEKGVDPPKSMKLQFPCKDENGTESTYQSNIFERSSGRFTDSQADLWFHVKSDNKDHCEIVSNFLTNHLDANNDFLPPFRQDAATKSTNEDKTGGKVLGCRFSENLNNPSSPITIQDHVVVGFEDVEHIGASYVFNQRFVINWEQIHSLTHDQIEDLIGRRVDDTLIPTRDTRSHIKSARVLDDDGNTMQLLRLGLPFGQSPYINVDDLAYKGSNIAAEEGIYFAGYAKSVRVLERITDSQIGNSPGFMRDRLFENIRSSAIEEGEHYPGGFFYIPSMKDLGLEPTDWQNKDEQDWSSFPGVNWERLDRHFTQRSTNGYMFYNHRDYLYRMSTMSGEDRDKYDPPSTRVLRLLSDAFSLWQDNWYFDRKQQELKHLRDYLEEYEGQQKADEVMASSIMERMGWTIKISLGKVFTSEDYGYRGYKKDQYGNLINGSDTYGLNPIELIVGRMPNIGLGQGRYVIDYTRDDEQFDHYVMGLSFASGVGHVVPGFQRILDCGVGGILKEAEEKRDASEKASKTWRFYESVRLAFEGMRDYLLRYHDLAMEKASKLCPMGQGAERSNLEAIAKRMKHLSTEKPETMLEAAQVVFTFHCCLHLIGEFTAIGRLDQMLQPFYEADLAAGRITEDDAQEIIDCFWIKVGEKVQSNRQHVEDHQPYGNLAMGGASGPYPQGAANNQWIQQVTVGGTVADDSPGAGKSAYNAVTKLCIRAARRLPLNAPCLSLRLRNDTPDEILEEAGKSILSGGAHPILLNDDKIIGAIAASGDGVGDGTGETDSTPVSKHAGELWSSKVELSHARDYACDGCYETQIVGRNWFVIGGFNSTVPMECALNQGRTYSSAGPLFFTGKNESFNSKTAIEIKSFEELEDIYFKHFKWMFAKQVSGLLSNYGRLPSVCPSPLLSALLDDCMAKGLGWQEGGAKYNVVGPSFFGLSTTINSMFAIQKMVYDPVNAVTSLPELVKCLICDWGYKMVEPFYSKLAGEARIEAKAERYKHLRQIAMGQQKFGRGNKEVDEYGREFIRRVAQTTIEVFTDPFPQIAEKMVDLAKRFGTKEQPFGGFQIQPGVGTFENYVEFGESTAASADGRRLGDTLASDLSPSPSYQDQPICPQEQDFIKALDSYTGEGTNLMSDGAPTDFNISEDYPLERLVTALKHFANGGGSNMLTVTCASSETMSNARTQPEKYDLLRVRMGGWSEFYTAMFPAHQEQHLRRPFNT